MIHHPKEREAQRALAKRTAAIHAQAVIEKIRAAPYPAEQKARLIDAVKARIPNSADGA